MNEPLFEINDGHELKIVKKIASGGMGTVYEAVQMGAVGFKKTMAIKTLMEDAAEDQEFVDMFISEAKLVADLIHENITQVYQLGEFKNTFYIAMEYINGINLQDFQERHSAIQEAPSEDICAFIISRVCRALEYAHNRRSVDGDLLNIVHRDVSPKNIMLAFEGVVKLTDFGIAKAAHLMDKEGDVLYGKVPYMSPEQASFKITDARSDIFSLGICFYELLTGEVLFGNQETIVTMQKIMREDVPPIRDKCPKICPKLEKIIHKALDRDLDKRYQAAGQMGTDLEHFLYDDGYGPTNLTLEKYLKELFPEKIPQYHK